MVHEGKAVVSILSYSSFDQQGFSNLCEGSFVRWRISKQGGRSTPSTATSPSARPTTTSSPRASLSRASGSSSSLLEFFEQRSILEHVWNNQKPELRATDVDLFKVRNAAVSCRAGHVLELNIHRVLGINEFASVHGSTLELYRDNVSLCFVNELGWECEMGSSTRALQFCPVSRVTSRTGKTWQIMAIWQEGKYLDGNADRRTHSLL